MELTRALVLIGTGLAAGILAGMFGIGGGIIVIPILVLVLGYSQHTASAMSLVALLLPVGILGALQYYRAGKITGEQVRLGLLISVGLFIGAYFGSRIAIALPAESLRKGFAVFLAIVAVRMWFL
ncbi:MAG: TSUP family transporter [Oligoflexia bacterium]|nr:TSUP family transporter [Oligoflexia bacterium]